MKNDRPIQSNSYRSIWIWLLVFGFAGTLLLRVFFAKYPTFRVFEFGWICLLVGLLPACFFRKYLKITHWLNWIAWSSALGLLMIPLISFLLGFLKLNIIFTHSVAFFYVISFIDLFILALQPSHMLSEVINSEPIEWADWVCLGIITVITSALTILVFTSIFISYDFFTFWGLDSRYIFEFNQLRDLNFDILSGFLYTPFYPSLLSVVYDLYGKLAENYAVWINVFIVFVSLLLIWSNLANCSSSRKIFITSLAGVLVILHRLLLKVPSPYADTLIAFLVLIFGLILINRVVKELKQIPIRIFLILLPLVCLSLVKQGLNVPALMLLLVWILVDFPLIREFLGSKDLINLNWLLPLSIMFFPFLQIWFVNRFQNDTGLFTTFESLHTQELSFDSSLRYVDDLAAYLLRMEPIIVILLVLLAFSVLWQFLKKDIHKNFITVTIICWMLTLFFFSGYVIWRIGLGNQSLARYVLIIIFLLPLAFTYFPTYSFKSSVFISVLFCVLILGYSLRSVYRDIPGGLKPNLNPLSYSETGKFETELNVSRSVRTIAGPSPRILILDEVKGDSSLLTNANESLYLRYFLMNESVGGQFATLPKLSYMQLAEEVKADFLLLFGFDPVFWECSELKQGHHYLIPVSPELVAEPDDCTILYSHAIDLLK